MKHILKSILTIALLSVTAHCAVEIAAPLSIGELVDKITILEIKMHLVREPKKLAHIYREWNKLSNILTECVPITDELQQLKSLLFSLNQALWDIEDAIRAKEAAGTFDKEFIELARSVYYTNDQRGDTKRKINEYTGSRVIEEKQYTRY